MDRAQVASDQGGEAKEGRNRVTCVAREKVPGLRCPGECQGDPVPREVKREMRVVRARKGDS